MRLLAQYIRSTKRWIQYWSIYLFLRIDLLVIWNLQSSWFSSINFQNTEFCLHIVGTDDVYPGFCHIENYSLHCSDKWQKLALSIRHIFRICHIFKPMGNALIHNVISFWCDLWTVQNKTHMTFTFTWSIYIF